MIRFPGVPRIVGVQLGEIRVRELSRSPAVMAKMALMTDTGQSAGVYILHQFSETTQVLLRELVRSMEADAAVQLSYSEEEQPSLGRSSYSEDTAEDDEGDEDALTFP